MDLMGKAKELEQLRLGALSPADAPLAQSATIFIIDDEELVRESMETLIRTLGYGTETFTSAKDCFSRGRIAEASCLITDVHMPDMTGFELLSRLHADGYRVPVIFMSGRSGEGLPEAAIEAGAIGFLEKPVNLQRLLKYLDKALNSGS